MQATRVKHSFFFDQQLYVKTGYKFPELNENSDIIKIELVSGDPESYKSGTIRDKEEIKKLISENLRNSGILSDAEGTNLKDYDIKVYFNNYFAYLALGTLSENKARNFGVLLWMEPINCKLDFYLMN